MGAPLTTPLRGDGIEVIDVPAKLAARAWVLSIVHGRKNDDAENASNVTSAQNRHEDSMFRMTHSAGRVRTEGVPADSSDEHAALYRTSLIFVSVYSVCVDLGMVGQWGGTGDRGACTRPGSRVWDQCGPSPGIGICRG